MKKIIVGNPDVPDGIAYKHLQNAYHDLRRTPWPLVEAVKTLKFAPTGRWRFEGDVDDYVIRMEMKMRWTETRRIVKWFPFLRLSKWKLAMTEIVELEPKVFHHTTWVTDTDIRWIYDDTIYGGDDDED